MPKVQYLNTPQIRLQRAVRAIGALGGVLHSNCRTGEDMGKALGLSPASALTRGKQPERMKLEELARFCVAQGYSVELRLTRDGEETKIAF